jgi:hypothetical protein
MNRLSQYITGMKLTRQLLREARLSHRRNQFTGTVPLKDISRSLRYLIDAFDAYVAATNCAISIREKKKPVG